MIEVGMFCYTRCSRYLDYGIKKGDLVYLAGDTMVRVDEKDPYAYRKLFIAAYVEDGHVNAERKPITIDGVNLRKVSDSKQKDLYKVFESDFAKAEES